MKKKAAKKSTPARKAAPAKAKVAPARGPGRSPVQREARDRVAAGKKVVPVKAVAVPRTGPPPANRFNGRFNGRPMKPGRGAPPPKIGRAAMGAKASVKPAKPAGPKKPSRQRVRICKQEGCVDAQTTQGFCRRHYLQNWRMLREEKAKRAQKNLDRYVERMAGQKKPPAEDTEEGTTETKSEEAVFEEDFGEFVDVLSREENLDKILNGIKVEDY